MQVAISCLLWKYQPVYTCEERSSPALLTVTPTVTAAFQKRALVGAVPLACFCADWLLVRVGHRRLEGRRLHGDQGGGRFSAAFRPMRVLPGGQETR